MFKHILFIIPCSKAISYPCFPLLQIMPRDYRNSSMPQRIRSNPHCRSVKHFSFPVSAAVILFFCGQLFQWSRMLPINRRCIVAPIAVNIRTGRNFFKYFSISCLLAQTDKQIFVTDNRRIAFPSALAAARDIQIIAGTILIQGRSAQRLEFCAIPAILSGFFFLPICSFSSKLSCTCFTSEPRFGLFLCPIVLSFSIVKL